ncbi:MAG TPA: hypothetical protein VIY28_02410 [Pseudonocardiaceae bacterium]
MTNISNVFQYGANESNGRAMGSVDQPQQSTGRGDVAPPIPPSMTHPIGPGERPADPRGGRRLTPAAAVRLGLLAVTIVLLGTAAGLAGALVWHKTYGARAEILYPISQDQAGGDPLRQDRQLSTQLVFLKSRAVLGPVAQKLGRQYTDIDRDVSVAVLQTSEVIQVEAHGTTKEGAKQTLQAVMDGYLALVGQPSGVTRNLDAQLADTRATTAKLQARVVQLTPQVLAGTATQVTLNDARTQVTASQDREKAIQARIDDLNLTGRSGPNAQLLTPPYVLPDPVSPQPLITAGTGALVGLLVAGGAVAMAARRRTSR